MLHFESKGYYTWAVLNQKDKIVRHAPTYSPNLILKQGLDGIAVRSWADSFIACAVGTCNSTPTKTQIGLDSESKRTSTYLDLVNANSSVLSGSNFTLRRTFVFPFEGGDVIYKEAGFSYSSVGPNALFSRVLLPNVLVSAGERMVIQYELLIKVQPTTATVLSNPIAARRQDTTGTFQYQRLGLKGVNSLGRSYDYDDAESCNEPSTAAKAFLSFNSTAPAAFGSVVDRSGTVFEASITLSTYSSGTYTRNKVFSILEKQALTSGWRSIGLGAASRSSYIKTGLVHVMNTYFTKNQGPMSVNFKFTWSGISDKSATLYYWQEDDQTMLRKQNILLQYYGQSND